MPRVRGKRKCCALNCKHFSILGDGKSMFKFPTDPRRYQIWVQRSGNSKNLWRTPDNKVIVKHLCPLHFEADQFRNNDHNMLNSTALPTIFKCSPLSDKEMELINTPRAQGLVMFPVVSASSSSAASFKFNLPPSTSIDQAVQQPAPSPLSKAHEQAAGDTFDPELNPKGKRPRDDEEEGGNDLEPPDKIPRTERIAGVVSRRALIPTGARQREQAPVKKRLRRVTQSQIAKVSGIESEDLPVRTKTKLVKTIQQYRQDCLQVKYKLKLALRKNAQLQDIANKSLVDRVDSLLVSSATRRILQGELRNLRRAPNGRQWTLEEKLFNLALYKRSPRAYRFLRCYICLPAESTLKSLLSEIKLKPGVCPALLKCLRSSMRRMKTLDKNCVLMFDEVYLNKGLFYNHHTKSVDGYEDYGKHGRTDRVADHALLSVVQGLRSKWTIPVAYYFVHKTTPSTLLKTLILAVLEALFDIGLTVLATISDQGPTNRGAVNLLKDFTTDDVCYEAHGHRLTHIFDVPHILKNVRNGFMKNDIEFDDGKIAKWSHVIEYFKLDEGLCKMSRLTYNHLNPVGKRKMKVILASEVFSETVSGNMETIYVVSEQRKLGNCKPTMQLLRSVDRYFDITNGPRLSPNSSEKKKQQRVNVTANSLHHTEWRKMIDELKKFTFISKIDGMRHVPPCIKGWISNLKSFQWLWSKMKALGFKEMKLRHLNQDPIENLFGQIRQCCGSGTDPTTVQFVSSLKTILITRCSGTTSSKNCMDDDSHLLSDLRSLVQDNDATEVVSQPPSLIRGATSLPTEIHEKLCKITRQAPTFTCAVIITEFLKQWDCSQCLKCLTTEERSSDLIFTLSANHQNLKQHARKFPSPHLINTFLMCQKSFISDCDHNAYKDNVVAVYRDKFEVAENWLWLTCTEHYEEVKHKLGEIFATTFLVKKCYAVNDAFQQKKLKKARQAAESQAKTPTTELVSEEYAMLYNISENAPPVMQAASINPDPAAARSVSVAQTAPGPSGIRLSLANRIKNPSYISANIPKAPPNIPTTSAEPVPGPSEEHRQAATPANRITNLMYPLNAPQATSGDPVPLQGPSGQPQAQAPSMLSESEVRDYVLRKEVHKLTVLQLKAILRGKVNRITLKKPELCEAVYKMYTS